MRKQKLWKCRFCAILFVVLLSAPAWAATSVSRNIEKDTIWFARKSPYQITNDIKLIEGATLEIEPGVIVEFYPEKSLEINGSLRAVGTPAKPILFTAHTETPWGNVSFTDFSTDAAFSESGAYSAGCILSNCIVEKGGGLFIRFGAPFITQCEIRNNVSSGIRVEFGAPTIMGNRIYGNSTEHDPASGNGGGIISYSDRNVRIADNIIYNNISDGGRDGGGGIYAYAADGGTAHIMNNVIFGNSSSRFGGGIYAYKAILNGNTVINNKAILRGGGIYAVESEVADNLVQGNSAERGAGIFSENASIKSNSIIRNKAARIEGGGLHYFGSGPIEDNCIAANSADGDEGCGGIYVSGNPLIRGNNILGNEGYALYIANVSDAPDVVATENYWGTSSEDSILRVTYDWIDNESNGLAIYKPFMLEQRPQPPMLPPFHVRAASRDGGIELTWEESPGANFTGHRIYISSESGYPYDTVLQTGSEKSFLITDLEPEKEYFLCVSGFSTRDEGEAETGLSEEVRLYFSPSEESLLAPVNLHPADGDQGVLRDKIILKAAPPEAGEAVVSYRWQVFAAGDSAFNPVLDTMTSGPEMDELTMGSDKLQAVREYAWRIASRSPTGSWSDWSRPTGFTTAPETAFTLSGPIDSEMHLQKAKSPYFVAGNTIIMSEGRLVIEPGVAVHFAPGKNLKVRGELQARGTADAPILFTRESSGRWGSIIFAEQCADAILDDQRTYIDGTILEFCSIDGGKGLLIESSSPLIKNCEIAGNGGSGITIRQGGPVIAGNDIHHNEAPTNGGGIYAYTNDIIYVLSNKIHHNTADGDGGGIYAYGYMNTSTIHVEDNDITANTATGNGGGVYLSRSSAIGNRIDGNTAKAAGGGIYSTFGLVDENEVTRNQAREGGGIFTEHNSSITRNYIGSNIALSQFGGGVFINFWGTSIENEVFTRNTVTANRGRSAKDNGGVYVLGYLVFENNNVYGNSGSQFYNGNSADSSPFTTSNCYWGSSDGGAISRMIVDADDDPALGKVTFEPFLDKPVKIN
ncbi:MAG: hypothetical protein C4520_00280 [Candidatus Abyssobacteria bacterium SURF_5]|uniref:Fibronectin type-III domain-containing protein n=1 Tax=Abyssobacteria bacterium (strain SURF_5) TaxID=2093360 RepID=A0A3A4P781_ABYX5|nr:MAG: hypothetical protein C4520_00280 [Candidatus Abyssubacteria bacterium SURF_5]